MTVVKACVCGKIKVMDAASSASDTKGLFSELPDSVMAMLSQTIFNNTGGDVVFNRDVKREILGTPTETAILEFGLALGGDFSAVRKASTIVKVEPFNSAKKRMGVVIQLPGDRLRAHCKGAAEIILASCNKYLNEEGNVVPLDEATIEHLKATIDSFASDALRTLCLAYMEVQDGFSENDQIPSDGYTCIGIVGIKDPIRPGVKESVAICRSAGITVRMVTGDNINTAKAIARECGILTEDGIAISELRIRKSLEI
jgi:Ca2+-transporting ATPase